MKEKTPESSSFDKVENLTIDVPLFIKLLEIAREEAHTDVELHELTERLISISHEKSVLTMSDYDRIVDGIVYKEQTRGNLKKR